jgi:hypothetical protein
MLACLYRNLLTASLSWNKIIDGGLLLLQRWSWTRFLIARPRPTGPAMQFGEMMRTLGYCLCLSESTTRHMSLLLHTRTLYIT